MVLCGNNKEERDIYKTVLLVSINAKSERRAIKAIRGELFKNGIQCEKTNKFIKGCIDKFKELHEPIATFINVGMGLSLQHQDSLITDKILTKMVKEGIPCLPIHDSFIVTETEEGMIIIDQHALHAGVGEQDREGGRHTLLGGVAAGEELQH